MEYFIKSSDKSLAQPSFAQNKIIIDTLANAYAYGEKEMTNNL